MTLLAMQAFIYIYKRLFTSIDTSRFAWYQFITTLNAYQIIMSTTPQRPRSHIRAKKTSEPNTKSSAYREYTERMTISVPRGLAVVLRSICNEMDLEYSKVFRRGLDTFIRDNRQLISPELFQRYQAFRRSVEGWE
jgi:hypothetical protein